MISNTPVPVSISSNSYAFHVLLPACVREQHNSRCCSVVVQDVAAVVQDAGCYCYDCCMAYCYRGGEDESVVAVALLQEREFLLW